MILSNSSFTSGLDAKMGKRKQDDVVYLIPEPESRRGFRKSSFLWFLAIVGIALCFLSFAAWNQSRTNLNLIDLFIQKETQFQASCSAIPDLEKFDCHPEEGATENECLKRGCCYKAVTGESSDSGLPPLKVPSCFYPPSYKGYSIRNITQDKRGFTAILKRRTPSGFPKDVQNLRLIINFISDCILRIKITDTDAERFEVPIPINDESKDLQKPCYNVKIDSNTGQLIITRRSNNVVIFSTNLSRLVYSDQFLQLSSRLPSPYFYGIGEHYGSFLRNVNWTRITLLNSDRAPVPNYPLYGAHPFYLSLEHEGNANGVFLLNSNPMDVILQPTPAVTFRPIGGILDFFIMLGPTPANIVQQYTSIVGRTFMPPYWSLGFHLCRYGYNSLNKTRETMERTIAAGIPLDVQWNDIDYMDNYKDFTYDKDKFAGLPEFVDELHNKGMHYVIIMDPGISSSEQPNTYPPFDDGLAQDIFIKNPNGTIFQGKVWTDGQTVYPDFSNPKTAAYWKKHMADLHSEVKYDGLWIDMNEPSNFYDGGKDGCMASSFEDPPYLPGGNLPLRRKTVCMTAKHYKTIHYNEHNLLAYRESAATNQALQDIRKKRPFIISRASFSGLGRQSGHWSGDISSSWEDMRYSIPSLLNFNLYGVSMIGSDICGFNGNTTVELCARWQALGAFYPFSRNHNERVTMEQDPVALGPTVVEATRNALYIRYSLLPYLYTLFYRSHVYGDTVVRPLFFEFPLDTNTYPIDEQFLWGPALMIMPALYSNVSTVTSYFPKGVWYNTNSSPFVIKSRGENFTLSASITKVNVAIRGGYILPVQRPEMTTNASRMNEFTLLACLDENKQAVGELYSDDGDSLDLHETKSYNLIQMTAANNVLKTSIVHNGYEDQMPLGTVSVVGLDNAPTKVIANNIPCVQKNDVPKYGIMDLLSMHKTFSAVNASDVNTCIFAFVPPNILNILTQSKNFDLVSPLTIDWN